jgi:hypothetical protein
LKRRATPTANHHHPMEFEKTAERIMYELWYEYATRLLERVVEVCELDKDQEQALRELFLRPNQFVLETYG